MNTTAMSIASPVVAAVRAEAERIGRDPLFRDAAGAKVLVTGATGMVGASLALAFLAADRIHNLGLTVYGLSRDMAKAKAYYEKTPLVALSRDVGATADALPPFDYIIHAASPVGPSLFASDPAGVVAANLRGTLNLLDKAVRDRSRRFLFISTHEVYGGGREVWREEDVGVIDFLSVRSCYPESKRAGENACVCFHAQHDLHTGVARLSRMIGPNMNLDSGLFVCDFLKDGLAGRPVTVTGDGSLSRPLLPAVEAVAGIVRILFSGKPGGVYNVSPDVDDAPSIRDVAEYVAALAGTRAALSSEGPGGGARQDNAKLRALGWRPGMSWRDGLTEIWKVLSASGRD